MGKKGGGKHLKSALLSQQSRLKAKEKISHAAQVQNQKASRKGAASSHPSASSVHQNPYAKGQKAKASSSSSLSSSSGHPKRPPTIPFLPTDRILLLGEGNFSFTRALVVSPPPPLLDNPIPPTNITATAYDSEQECYEKYSDAREIVGLLRETGVNVVFGVDATKLARCAALKGKVWDKIVWNFPHAGKGITDQDRNILTNQLLLLDFLASASKVLAKGPVRTLAYGKKKKRKPGDEDEEEDEENDGDEMEDIVPTDQPKSRGTVLITLRNVAPYTSWDVPRLAKNPPPPQMKSAAPYPKYTILRSFQFHRHIWKGYEHRMTKGERAHGTGKTGEGGEDRTWEFYLSDVQL